MRKKILCLAMMAVMVIGMGTTAKAEDYESTNKWLVEFTADDMKSNFKSSKVADDFREIQPGDSMTLKIALKNSDSGDTDWYMTNEVLKTLEEAQDAAKGGGYEYCLTYYDPAGTAKELFNSKTVGGENSVKGKEGLHEATDSLEDYFYLGRIGKGQNGSVQLRLVVDGETQGNAYQETFASLQMNFAVEKVAAGTGNGTGEIRKTVKTGDTSKLMLLSLLALASGMLLLIFGLRSMKRNRRTNRKGE